MESGHSVQAERWMRIGAWFVIYVVWGSAYLAIRQGVREVPPFPYAAIRFLAAGAILVGWCVARGEALPTLQQLRSTLLLGFSIFTLDYGLLFWAEQRVPSGVAAVLMAVIPALIAVAEIVLLRTLKMSGQLAVALVIGLTGVAVLMVKSLDLGGAAVDPVGAIALGVAALAWAVSSVMTRRLDLPKSKAMNSGAQMLAGGFLLLGVSAALGEFGTFQLEQVSVLSWVALVHLTISCSVIGFTAYLWLLHRESPTRVGTYAYVNPVVAVLLGHFVGGEDLGVRTVVGTACILLSVVAIRK